MSGTAAGSSGVLVEERHYRLRAGRMTEYLERYAETGLELQRRHLGRLAGWYTTEIGEANTIVHLWAYRSFDERAVRRRALAADEQWRRYAPPMYALIAEQRSTLLRPAPFFAATLAQWFPDLADAMDAAC